MSNITAGYPLDRYLIDSNKNYEMVNIIDDELWNKDPALKPEDELILRKLHEMLQSTADDLKLLSGELSKFHQPGVQIKTSPTPLDDEFNEKVHIEEIVNAKFHGYNIIDKSSTTREPEFKLRNDVNKDAKPTSIHKAKTCNNSYQINTKPILKKSMKKNLGITRIKHIQIDSKPAGDNSETLNNEKLFNVPVAYKEYKYNDVQPNTFHKDLKLQEMPRVNIRSELKMQKVFQLDIMPDLNEFSKINDVSKNIAVVSLKHEPIPSASSVVVEPAKQIQPCSTIKPTVRKISKMSTCESSASTNNISSDTQNQVKLQKHTTYRTRSSKNATFNDRKKINSKREQEQRSPFLDEWRKKLNLLYGSSTSKNSKPITKNKAKSLPSTKVPHNSKRGLLNNAEYIPYSKLTIGGARASDIEKVISSIPNKHNMPLSPVLDKIISSRENSLKKNKLPKSTNSLKVLTTSDENLLHEVMDIEKTVSETLSRSVKCAINEPKCQKTLSDDEEAKENVSYVDDFEEEKSDHSGRSQNKGSNGRSSSDSSDEKQKNDMTDNDGADEERIENDKQHLSSLTVNNDNLTRPKISNLAFKNKIDVFDYVHAIDTQETATQSNLTEKITPKETQTTPRNDSNVQAMHNNLWPSMDPNGRVEKMFELEKEFIKKLIIDEYGDILEKNITKPSSSKESEVTNNVAAFQKHTQTSPAHAKNVMTSPKRTKTRTTSPFTKLTADHHTSPLIFVTGEDEIKVELEEEDLAISINLSSPRFSLRLPRNSQEVISNLGDCTQRTDVQSKSKFIKSVNTCGKNNATDKRSVIRTNKSNINVTTTSTSSIEADSSEISSLGEVRLRRMFANITNNSDCESLCSTSSKYSSDLQSGLLPLRSEGEMSVSLRKTSTR